MQFCDLPTEILFQIINEQRLNAEDLYGLATLSRLLNGISLPPYLRLHMLHDPSFYSAIYIEKLGQTPRLLSRPRPALDGLSGLAISTNLTTIDHLVCYIYGFRASDSTFRVMERKLSQLCRLINRLERISQFRLYLLGTFAPQFGRIIPDKDLQIWTTSIGGLLNTVINRRCTELTVHSGCWSEDPYRFYSVNPLRKPLNTVGYLFKNLLVDSRSAGAALRGLNWEFRRPMDRGCSRSIVTYASPQSLAISALRLFIIQSRIFLIPPHLNWTISVLSFGANITSLTFRLTHFKPGIWAVILTQIAEVMSVRLKEVCFQPDCHGLRFGDLLKFLSKCPSLTHLEIHGACKVTIPDLCTTNSFTSHKCPFIVPHLPNLQVLSAPFHITCHLMSKRGGPTIPPLPSLHEWVVFFEGSKLLGNYSYLEDCHQKHGVIRERLMAGGSLGDGLKFSAHILGHPYSYQMPLFPDEAKFAEAEATATLPQFLQITRVIYNHMPVRQELLQSSGSFFKAVNQRFPEQREIKISESYLNRTPNGIAYGTEDAGNESLKTTEEVLLLLQRWFGKLESVATEKRVYHLI